ncbi:phosphate ABC transporter substrate-binding protein PstS [Gluconacetobacter azotocaptans]|uniref:Phosphate-binding protein PstS n=1 Tax=Gluconacetobacter azotocaptans TaxID=142834 RepID=A0A7W4JUB2_9PROT|nr:phosphate ABC transporter substrate-binding protein PstS [Gluconacetobacter azotocaptans]MBB2191057.1 phosphate ABC transporter substrate-binding protein PstS [Gluconacetobacter azotocaptans]MBM9401978.1 phosphate ABC transporter substrate-binding protein PstS [Gluconacetobacter azotocaptans]GBQ36388.1 phosphate-binding periplasmic protein [Gluconacetobacter azotocaptans DSM 13594]
MRRPVTVFAAVLLAASPAALSAAHAAGITGAGSSFAAPIYEAWGAAGRSASGIAVNYQSVGSSAGQNQILAGTVDFGASDAPMDPAKLEKGALFQFPTVMGGIVPVVNIPGVAPGKLRLTGEVLAGIYAGDIASWNDPKITALNPGVALPDLPIATVHRADGSGTTFVFTSYLAGASQAWHDGAGAGSSISWPGGVGARGNDGVAASVRNTEGGIGYVEYAYASRNHMTTVQLKDKAGDFVTANLDSFSRAAAAADWKGASNFAVDLLDTAGKGAWPIVSATYVLVPKQPKDAAQGAAVRKFFGWAFDHGDGIARGLDYVVLPASVKTSIRAAW